MQYHTSKCDDVHNSMANLFKIQMLHLFSQNMFMR